MVPDAALLERFRENLDRLIDPDEGIGLAVSGGPDSLAMLLLAAAARPGKVAAATVDHALRPESKSEAEAVAAICAGIAVPHRILTVRWREKPSSALQEKARAERYALLASWLRTEGLSSLCTAHHREDQAETLLMRLMRGSGLRGLAAMRPSAAVPGGSDLRLLRPLLGWSRAELAAVCDAAGVTPADDPTNSDPAFERVRVRQWIGPGAVDAEAIARSAAHLRSAEEAVEWAVEREWSEAVEVGEAEIRYEPRSIPGEIRRRVVGRAVRALASEGGAELRGGELDRLVATLASGDTATLRGVRCTGGATWRFEPAPRRFPDRRTIG